MSYHDDYSLTEAEQESGLGYALKYGYFPGDAPQEDNKNDLERQYLWHEEKLNRKKTILSSGRYRKGILAVSHLNDLKEIKNNIIKKIIRDSIDKAIINYFLTEKLSKEYLFLVKDEKCIKRLIEGILFEVANIKYNNEISNQIETLSSNILKNNFNKIAYDRVALVQKFIHDTVDLCCWVDAHKNLPIDPIKNALSVIRIHLLVYDAINSSVENFFNLEEKTNISKNTEKTCPRYVDLLPGKIYVTHWRVKHLSPLSQYMDKNNSLSIDTIEKMYQSICESPTDETHKDRLHFIPIQKTIIFEKNIQNDLSMEETLAIFKEGVSYIYAGGFIEDLDYWCTYDNMR